jgi:hypothetical protein
VTKLAEPQRVEAIPQDIKLAQQAVPVNENPPPAPPAELDRIKDLVLPAANPPAVDAATPVAEAGLAVENRKILQWQPDWVQYDQYFRPLIFNPFPDPLQLVYQVLGVSRILLIPPLGRIVTEVRDLGSYNFTALRLDPAGVPMDVAVAASATGADAHRRSGSSEVHERDVSADPGPKGRRCRPRPGGRRSYQSPTGRRHTCLG